jgi:hypothetical protein
MSLLLLDDDEGYVPPTKTAKRDVLMLDGEDEVEGFAEKQPNRSAATNVPQKDTPHTATSLSAATRSAGTPLRCAADAATVTFALTGGNGMAKMEALAFGGPKVCVVPGVTGAVSVKPAYSSAASLDRAFANAAAAQSTPTAQKTRPPSSSPLNSEVRSNVSASTQPKIVSGARSSSSLSPLSQQQQVCAISPSDSPLFSQDQVVETHTALNSPDHLTAASPSASPAARPPVMSSPPSSVDVAPTQPAKTQMKLSDFFSKMACKR